MRREFPSPDFLSLGGQLLLLSKLREGKISFSLIFILLFLPICQCAQSKKNLSEEIKSAILKATKYFDEKVSVEGGYVWHYSPDLSRRWGELEANSTMAWVQGAGTVAMGNTFLDIYEATQDEYFYSLAEKSAFALIKGQLACGGWNYVIDYAGEESIVKWYDTIGKNAWRLEEFQHYYGNATFDDAATQGAATFLLRVYLIKSNSQIKTALDKAINFILESQYPLGGWPQRFPATDQFRKNGNPDYTSYYTFNDNAMWNNIKFLFLCYAALGEKRLIDPIKKAMDFYLLLQQPKPQAGWAQQYSMDLKPAAARSYEPQSLDPQYTERHIELLIKYYELTGDKKYLSTISDALDWLEEIKISSDGDFYKVGKFIELGTNKIFYTHRVGSNVKCGRYFYDYNSENDLKHYHSIRTINMGRIKEEYKNVQTQNIKIAPKDTLWIPGLASEKTPYEIFKLLDETTNQQRDWMRGREPDSNFIKNILSQLDSEGRWLTTRVYISNPYIGEPKCIDPETNQYSGTEVGDEYDTSPYPNNTEQQYLSTAAYMMHVNILLKYLEGIKERNK